MESIAVGRPQATAENAPDTRDRLPEAQYREEKPRQSGKQASKAGQLGESACETESRKAPTMAKSEPIAVGVELDKRGTIHVAPENHDRLCALAIDLQDGGLAVDVQHVLAALVMAVRDGRGERELTLAEWAEPARKQVLARYIQLIFSRHGGEITGDDD